MLFYYSVLAVLATSIIVVVESFLKDQSIRLWEYDAEQWGWTIGACIVNFIGLNCQVIAMQNERSGFITLLGYIGLVYAFLGDLFIFKEEFYWVELLGILIILVLNISLIINKK